MGFYEHNSLGKFNAEIKSDLPSFGADTLTGRPGSSGELDFNADTKADITNYTKTIFSKFRFDDDGKDGDGVVTSRGDKGFDIMIRSDADIATQPVTISNPNKVSQTYTWDLAPGDRLTWSHVPGKNRSSKEVSHITAAGTRINTVLDWIPANSQSRRYQIALGLPVAAQTGDGNTGNGNDGTGNGGDDGNGTGNGTVVEDEETNWALWGGIGLAALVGVGIVMSKRK